MGKKMQKRTKKFVQHNLERTVKARRIKQKFARKDAAKLEKRKARDEQKNAGGEEEADTKKKIEALDVDEFLEGKFFASDEDAESGDDGAIDEVDEGDEEPLEVAGGDEGDDAEDSDDDMDGMDEAEFHRLQLENLKKSDPEFYQHLAQHDKSLLEFKVGDEDGEEEETEAASTGKKEKPKTIMEIIAAQKNKKATDGKKNKQQEEEGGDEGEDEIEEFVDEEDGEEEEKPKSKSAKKKKKPEETVPLTLPQLKKWKEQLRAHSKPALKNILRAFRSAAHISDDAKEGANDHLDVVFADSKVFNNVVRAAFQMVPVEFAHHLGEHDGSLKSNPRWPKIEPFVRSYLGNLVHFVSKVLDISMIRLVLAHLERMMIYFEPFHKLALKFLKGLLSFWSTSEEDVRIDAFLRIRQLVLTLSEKSQILEHALKGIYLTYVRNSSFASKESLPTLNFMANCVVELYSLEPVSSYQHSFVYIRQLAIHLRNAIHAKTKEAYRGVYNWKFVSCLRVWALLLAAHGAKPDSYLHPLIYPLVQVCIGVLDLLPSSRYFPLRFNVIRTLNKLAEATNTYIPLGSYLMDAIHTALQTKKAKKSMGAPPGFLYILKVTKATAASKNYQAAVVTEALNLLLAHLAVYSYSVAFPELAIPIQLFLRREKKSCNNGRLQKPIAQFLLKVEANSKFITAQRSVIDYSPQDAVNPAKKTFKQLILEKDKNAVSPLEKFVKLQLSAEKDDDGRLLTAEQMQSESRSRSKKGEEDEEEEDDDDEEEEDEDEDEAMGGEGDEEEEEGEGDEGDDEEAEEKRERAALLANEKRKRKREAEVSKVMQRADEPDDELEDFVLSESDEEPVAKKTPTANKKPAANKQPKQPPAAKKQPPTTATTAPATTEANKPTKPQKQQQNQQPKQQNQQPKQQQNQQPKQQQNQQPKQQQNQQPKQQKQQQKSPNQAKANGHPQKQTQQQPQKQTQNNQQQNKSSQKKNHAGKKG